MSRREETSAGAVLPGEPAVGVMRDSSPSEPHLPRRLVLVFALATGLAVANNYYAQPLLDVIARHFGTSSSRAGLIVTFTQAGYALGLVLLVPLGDLVDRRRLILGVLVATTLGLLVSGVAPSIAVLIAFSLAVGFTSVVAQIIVPFAASLAPEAERGQVVGTVMSGLLLGILLARGASGLLSRELPREPRRGERLTWPVYARLLHSVLALLRDEPVLRRRSFYGAMTFAAFSVFWTSLAFLLSRPPYDYGQAVIGLFGLLGAVGAITASVAGRLSDRGLARATTGGFLLAALVSFALIGWGAHQLLPLIAGVMLLDLGAQGVHITNQGEIYRLQSEARSRITTAYMTSYFIGGSLGSASSALAYARYGWYGVALLGAAYIAAGLGLWLVELMVG